MERDIIMESWPFACYLLLKRTGHLDLPVLNSRHQQLEPPYRRGTLFRLPFPRQCMLYHRQRTGVV